MNYITKVSPPDGSLCIGKDPPLVYITGDLIGLF